MCMGGPQCIWVCPCVHGCVLMYVGAQMCAMDLCVLMCVSWYIERCCGIVRGVLMDVNDCGSTK